MKKEYKKEKNLMINYKNSEIKSYCKLLEQYEDYFKKNKIDLNAKKNTNFNGNNSLDYEKIMMEMKNKDKIIKSLNSKINEYTNEYKNVIEINQLSQQKNNVFEQQIQNLINDKNELTKENEKLKGIISNVINKTKEANIIYTNKRNALTSKLKEYKLKVITLKKKVCELHKIIEKIQNGYINNKNQSSVNNYNNIYLEKNQNPSTPSQLHKISALNNNADNNQFNNIMKYTNGKMVHNNSYKSFENNIRNRSNFIGNKNGYSNDKLELKQKKAWKIIRSFYHS
jgi:chromosome segregation ATPase